MPSGPAPNTTWRAAAVFPSLAIVGESEQVAARDGRSCRRTNQAPRHRQLLQSLERCAGNELLKLLGIAKRRPMAKADDFRFKPRETSSGLQVGLRIRSQGRGR